jgi:large repetitive protein
MSDGGGIAHVGVSQASSNSPNLITRNQILLNQTFNQSADPTGGGLFIGGQIPVGGGNSQGTSHVTVDRNLIQYNHAGAGAGGGVSIARTASNDNVVLTNNMIANNAAAYAGGGVAVTEASSNVRLVNNTVADNVSTATNGKSFPAGQKVQSTAQIAGIARFNGTNPTLLNNIIWGNRSFTWSITPTDPNLPQTTVLADAGIWDLGVLGDSSHTALPSTNSVLTAGAGNSATINNVLSTVAEVAFVRRLDFLPQTDSDQPGVLPETTIMQTALTFDEGGNFINVNFSPLSPWSIVPGPDFGSTPRTDYHIKALSSAVNKGANRTNANRVPGADYDAQVRTTSGVDIGADELPALPPTLTSLSPITVTRPARGSTDYTVTFIGTNLAFADVTLSGTGVTVSNVVATANQITATFRVSSNAARTSRTVTVTTTGGTVTGNITVN